MAKYAVIGAGSWGTTVAAMVAPVVETVMWARNDAVAQDIEHRNRNSAYLDGFDLPESLHATSDIAEALTGADVVVMGVPSHGYRTVLEACAPLIDRSTPIVSLSKGIEAGTLMRMTEVTLDVLPDHDPSVVGVLTGPNLAREITDVVGAESAGAVKNVMAIAAGMASGKGYGDNTLATLVTRALVEMTRLGVAMGGDYRTFPGLAGLGDLIATCNSSQSRNHKVGFALGQGRTLDEVTSEMNMVAEGVKSTRGVLQLAQRHGVEMPIAVQVGRVIYDGVEPGAALHELMTRVAGSEYSD
jgi:glycerol-3-phosphate dehydrogenase (NAD(P)+)